MPVTKTIIVDRAERYGFTVVLYRPGPGTRADIELRDERSGETIVIGVWPEYSEAELLRLLSMAAGEVRGSGPPPVERNARRLHQPRKADQNQASSQLGYGVLGPSCGKKKHPDFAVLATPATTSAAC